MNGDSVAEPVFFRLISRPSDELRIDIEGVNVPRRADPFGELDGRVSRPAAKVCN